MTSRLARVLVLPVLLAATAAAAQQASPPPRPQVRQLCAADVQRLCPQLQPGHGAIAACLKDHMNDVSADCRSALAAMRERARQRQGDQAQPPAADSSPPR
jgi:Cysteine rich repeat